MIIITIVGITLIVIICSITIILRCCCTIRDQNATIDCNSLPRNYGYTSSQGNQYSSTLNIDQQLTNHTLQTLLPELQDGDSTHPASMTEPLYPENNVLEERTLEVSSEMINSHEQSDGTL